MAPATGMARIDRNIVLVGCLWVQHRDFRAEFVLGRDLSFSRFPYRSLKVPTRVLAQEGINFGPQRRDCAAAETSTFESRGGCGKAHRLEHALSFCKGKRKAAVKYIPCGECIDRINLEDGHAAQHRAVAPYHIIWAIGHGEKRPCMSTDYGERGREIVGADCLA